MNPDLHIRNENVRAQYRVLAELTKSRAIGIGDLSNALKEVLEASVEILKIERISVWLYGQKGGEVECIAKFDYSTHIHSTGDSMVASDFPAYFGALQQEESVVAHDARTDVRTKDLLNSYLIPNGITSLLNIPIWLNGQIKGLLCCEHTGPRRQWTLEDQQFALSISNFVTLALEVFERKRTEKRIIESESNLRAIIDNSDSFIWLINTNYEIIDYNSSFAFVLKKLLGIELRKRDIALNLLPSEAHKIRWKNRFDQALSGNKGIYFDVETFNGKEYVLEIKTFPIHVQDQITGVSIYLKDITDTKLAERKLRKQNEELKKLNSELDKLVYSASHDLRAPLMSVLGLINISRYEQDESAKTHYLDLMRASVHKLDSFIQDIIDLSRNSRLDIQENKIDFKKLINGTFESLQYLPGANQIHKIIKVHSSRPFFSDEKRLKVIFNNLLSNCIRYSNLDQEKAKVCITIKVDKAKAVIEVKDNGIGIHKKHIEKIFDMFYRANDQKVGSGLGLYIVKETVEKLHGAISIASELNQGTTMQLTIPNVNPNVQPLKKVSPSLSEATGALIT